MKYKYLLDIAPFAGARVQKFDGVMPFLSTGDLQGNNVSFEDITYDNKPSRADIKVEEGDILFARMKDTKKVLVIDKILSNCIVSTGFAVLHPPSITDAYYLSFYFKSDDFETQKSKYCSGAIQPAITNAGIRKIKIPFPPDNDRKRIAYLLSKIENLIFQRKQSLQQLDELIKSTFFKMFGDPIINEKKWNKKQLIKIANIKIGPFGSLLHAKDYIKNGVPIVNPTHIVNSEIVIDNNLTISEQKYNELINYALLKDDIVIGRRGEIGRSALVKTNKKLLCGTGSMFIRLKNKELLPSIVQFLISNTTIKNFLHSKSKGITMKNLNSKVLEELSIIIPPEDLQNKFIFILNKVDFLKNEYKQSLLNLENLYNSLCHKAFKGELDLAKVPIAIKIDLEAEEQVRFPESVEKLIELQERIIPEGMTHLYDPNSAINIVNRVSKWVDIPDYHSWQQSTAFDEEYEELENDYKQLNEQDIRQIFDHSKKALSFKELLDKLEKITTIELQNYEFMKTVLYKMLANNELEQIKVDINKGKKDKPTEFILKFKRIVA